MIKISHPTKALKGTVELPSSKSISNRVLLIQALCNDAIEITNLSAAHDTVVMQQALQSANSTIDVGDAGTAMRFLLAYYAIQPKQTTLTGSARMQQRPVGPLVDALRQMGADITYLGTEGYPPVSITGNANLKSAVSISGSVSSQYLSALMMIAPKLKNGLEITIEGEPISYSYLEITQAVMEHFGAEVVLQPQSITINPKPYTGGDVAIEADWSAASYFFEMVALAKKATWCWINCPTILYRATVPLLPYMRLCLVLGLMVWKMACACVKKATYPQMELNMILLCCLIWPKPLPPLPPRWV